MNNVCTSPEEAENIARWWATRYPATVALAQGLHVFSNGERLNENDLEQARREMKTRRGEFVPDSFYEQLARALIVDLRHLGQPFWLVQDEKAVVASGPSVEYLKGWRACLWHMGGEKTREKEEGRYVVIDGKRLVDMVRAS